MADIKEQLRKELHQVRASLAGKHALDQALFERLVALPEYQQADTLLCYHSTSQEVDTHRLIGHALREGKRLALPRCRKEKAEMDFYFIRSCSDLVKGQFSLWEPSPDRCERLTELPDASLCIVPGLSFDPTGFRLGYGGGYYDRFLADYDGISLGLCYEACIRPILPREAHDCRVDILLTEQRCLYR